jgi:hypothetical protein
MNEQDRNAQLGGNLAESLLQVNKLAYRMPPQLSIASNRTIQTMFSNQSVYTPSNTIIFDVQSGSAFVDPADSYLRFKLQVQNNAGAGVGGFCLGSGSATNVLQRITIFSKTGKELSRVEDANVLNCFMNRYKHENDWVNTLGANEGLSVHRGPTAYADEIPAGGKVFCIPLKTIFPCFCPINGSLMPPNLLSGMRVELRLAPANIALASDDGTVADPDTYVITRPELKLRTYMLADQFARKIQEMSATAGLAYLYREHFHAIFSSSNTQINTDVKKACSKALKAHVYARNTADLVVAGRDKLASAKYQWDKFQSNIGQNYYPNQPVSVDDVTTDGNAEAYRYTMINQGKHYGRPPAVTPTQYTVRDDASNYCNSVVTWCYNKSTVSDFEGATISNSRSLLLNLTKNAGGNANLRLDIYLTFLRLCKVMQSNVLVLD